MKANEAPERVYCESDGLGNIVKVHNIKWPDDEAENIEYVRIDAFIEKAAKWINEHTSLSEKLVIENFKKQWRNETDRQIRFSSGDREKN